jgi:hypothetical protein
MARGYPRFIFADTKNTKSDGPFVIHLLEPRLIYKVEKTALEWTLQPLDKAPSPDNSKEYQLIFKDALTWLHYQIREGFITL